jgi:hypothetical protein
MGAGPPFGSVNPGYFLIQINNRLTRAVAHALAAGIALDGMRNRLVLVYNFLRAYLGASTAVDTLVYIKLIDTVNEADTFNRANVGAFSALRTDFDFIRPGHGEMRHYL